MRLLRPFIEFLPPTVAGTVLLLAAALKLHAGFADPKPISVVGVSVPLWIHFAVALLELVLGLCLVVQLWPRSTRIAAVGVFAGFAVLNAGELWLGTPSCHCFGSVHLAPTWALVADVAVVAGLLVWSSAERRETGPRMGACPSDRRAGSGSVDVGRRVGGLDLGSVRIR